MDYTLTGELVGLRLVRDADLESFVAWWSDPRTLVTMAGGKLVARPAEQVAETFRLWSSNQGSDAGLAVVELATGELIGHIALYGATVKDRCATLNVMIGAPYQGRGLGTDAVRTIVGYGFTGLGLHRIELTVNGDNPAAIAAYRKAGFVEEGRLREAFFQGGRWQDFVRMGVLAREFREGAAPIAVADSDSDSDSDPRRRRRDADRGVRGGPRRVRGFLHPSPGLLARRRSPYESEPLRRRGAGDRADRRGAGLDRGGSCGAERADRHRDRAGGR